MWLWWLKKASGDLTDVTLVTVGLLETWLMWLWLLRRPFRDLTDVTLVSDDILRILDWYDSGEWGWKLSIEANKSCLLVKFDFWWKLSSDGSCLLMKVVFWWKLSIDDSCLLMKIVFWWKLSINESCRDGNCLLMKVIIVKEVISCDVSPVAMFYYFKVGGFHSFCCPIKRGEIYVRTVKLGFTRPPPLRLR